MSVPFSSPLAPHIPVWDKSARHDGSFSRADFVFDPARNIYICPGGAELTSAGNIDQGHIGYYRASKNDCATCSLKPNCTTAVVRKITRDLNEDVSDRVRALANTEAFQKARQERKKVEMRFAHMKLLSRAPPPFTQPLAQRSVPSDLLGNTPQPQRRTMAGGNYGRATAGKLNEFATQSGAKRTWRGIALTARMTRTRQGRGR